MKVRLAGIVLAISLLGASALSAASRPPRELHRVGDHWTAWNPPAPVAGVETYTIARGDTLWGLAKRFYGNPYLWPQLWEKNQYILDAHWIYPGDPLVTGIQVAPVDNLAQVAPPAAGAGTSGEPEPEPPPQVPGVESAAKATSPPAPLGWESDIYCSGYISDPGEQFPYEIIGSEFDNLTPKLNPHYQETQMKGVYGRTGAKVDMFTGDIVYLNGGAKQGLVAGSLFTIVGPEREVVHPVTAKVFGSFYQYRGRVRVLSVQDDTAIAEIVHSCDAVLVGDRLRPFEPEPVPLGRTTPLRPVNLPVAGEKLKDAPAIIYARDAIIDLGQDHVVWIDRGTDQNVTPGDIFTIYRTSDRGLPPLVLGELAVLSVQKRSATAKIIESRYTIFVGDRLDQK
ncbi:MAG TPA: LysM peptidoglycan-binding domain-containing protein [Thermoanaerobaculia bacterium]|nr:LysM peptidoglycan-binding domain-containing protein [Thermoanaerobaculia bacterium]